MLIRERPLLFCVCLQLDWWDNGSLEGSAGHHVLILLLSRHRGRHPVLCTQFYCTVALSNNQILPCCSSFSLCCDVVSLSASLNL